MQLHVLVYITLVSLFTRESRFCCSAS